MIVRTSRGFASPDRRDAYPEHFRRTVLPALRPIQGFRGATLLREERDEMIEYLVLTRWQDMDAIHAFAGTDALRAVVEPDAWPHWSRSMPRSRTSSWWKKACETNRRNGWRTSGHQRARGRVVMPAKAGIHDFSCCNHNSRKCRSFAGIT